MYAITLAAVWRVRYVHTTALRVRARDMCTGYGTCAPVHLETAVSARESKFIEPRDSSIRPSLLCQDICSLARGTELEITIKHPTSMRYLLIWCRGLV